MRPPLFPLARAFALCMLLSAFANTQAQQNHHVVRPATAKLVPPTSVHSCRDMAARAEQYRDGLYWFHLQGQSVLLYCHDMAGTPREYLELPQGNCSEYASRAHGTTRRVQTCFDKVRIDPETLRVDVSDLTFSKTRKEGRITHDQQVVEAMPYATAMACDAPDVPVGRASITLTGTGFAALDTFKVQGFRAQGDAFPDGSAQKWELRGGGFCGWIAPGAVYNPQYSANWNPFQPGSGFLLQLRTVDGKQKRVVAASQQDAVENDTGPEQACRKRGGDWIPQGMLGTYNCVLKAPDAGKYCSDGSQCQSERCIYSEGLRLPGKQWMGTCAVNNSHFGCYQLVQNGNVTPALCVD